MKLAEAQREAHKHNRLNNISARIVRILPAEVDPVRPDDNGWDVEITVTGKVEYTKPKLKPIQPFPDDH